jgi:hypothetical protein
MSKKHPQSLPNIWQRLYTSESAQQLRTFLTRPRVRMLLKIVSVFSIFYLIILADSDPDFGWHLASGRYYLSHGIPSRDVFSYTAPTFRWINHEWGNDTIMWCVYFFGGYTLVAALYASLWTAALFVVDKKTRFIVLLLSITALLPYVGARPIAWTVLFSTILYKLCVSRSRNAYAAIVLLFLLWANLHAGFIVGIGILVYFAVRKRQLKWFGVLVGCVLISFVNPYGIRLYTEIFRTLFDHTIHTQITEWRAFYFVGATREFLLLWLVAFWFYNRRKFKNWLSLQVFLLLAAASASRNVPLFVVLAQKDISYYFTEYKRAMRGALKQKGQYMIVFLIVLSCAWTIYVGFSDVLPRIKRAGPWVSQPQQAVAYLQTHPCHGNVFSSYDYGGYLIWKLPTQLVYIDGRMPTWKDEQGKSYVNRYLDVLSNERVQQEEFTRYNIHCALLKGNPNERLLMRNLEKDGWIRVFQNGPILLKEPAS